MDKEQLKKYLRHELPFTEESLDQLHRLITDLPWFQAGWMLYLKNLKILNSPDFESVLKKVAILVPDRRQLYKFLNNEIKLSETSGLGDTNHHDYHLDGQNVSAGDSLIDRFLSSGPGIRQKKGPENATEDTRNNHIIKKSVEESDDLITETLANIYFEQKNYEKALVAYEKLSLKYPEKSIYFASRIKEIEVIKNNT
ncbi:tetratricopeptide repeat protein [Maribellus mangrovi]|uniref:tetratricopeptide repeat protein n=1 Tax=Maribellus mangrovi TaxID=3133146 RepID=UPI0030EF7B0B